MTVQYLGAWIELLPIAAAMVLTWVGASFFWLRLMGFRPLVSAGLSPAVTTSMIWVLSVLFYRLGFFWSGARVLPVLAAIGIAGFWLHSRKTPRHVPDTASKAWGWWVLGGWFLAVLPVVLFASPANPVQQWDPTFHMNGVWSITQTGVAAPGVGLSPNFGGAPSVGYPIGWHAFTSLFATGTTTVAATNAGILAMAFLWVGAASALSFFLYRQPVAAGAGAIIAGVLPSMPTDALTAYSQAPAVLSLILTPGLIMVLLLLGRQWRSFLEVKLGGQDSLEGEASSALSVPWRTTLAAAIALWGGIQAHPGVAFNLLVFLAVPAVAGLVSLAVWGVRNTRMAVTFVAVSTLLVGIGVVTAATLTPQVASMRAYRRFGVDLPTAFEKVVMPLPPFQQTWGLLITTAAVTTLVFIGILWTVLARYSALSWAHWPSDSPPPLWPVGAYAGFIVLTFFAYGPNWAIRPWLVGPWFSDGRRIMEPLSLTLVLLAGLGFQWLAIRIDNFSHQPNLGPPLLGATLLLSTGLGGLDGRGFAVASAMDPSRLGSAGMASQEALDLMRDLPNLTPEDAIILGDPKAGGAYAQMIGQRTAYFPQLTLANADRASQEVLVQRFNQIHTNPEVCEVVLAEGITHFYQTPDSYYFGTTLSARAPGLYNVDTSRGFELVAQAPDVSLYRITACD